MATRTIVIDPGQGEAKLPIVREVRDRLVRRFGARVVVAGGSLGPRERARVAFHNAADVFVCLGEGPGADVATDPRHHHPATRIFLSPRGRSRIGSSIADEVERHLEADAASPGDCPSGGCLGCDAKNSQPRRELSVEREVIDVWNEVPMVPQRTGMSCWAAAAAMIVGWRDSAVIDPEQIAQAGHQLEAYHDGLEPENVPALAQRWNLHLQSPGRYSLSDFRELLERHGPLWVGEASPGLHSIVVTGMRGDGTPDGTVLHIADPWPLRRGERYSVTFREFMRNFEAASGVDGVDAQILHAGGRGGGPSHSMHIQESVTARTWTTSNMERR